MRRGRNVRASFLLRVVSFAVSLGVFFLVFRFATSAPLTVATLVVLVLFWLVGIEWGLLPHLIQRAVLARAETSPASGGSLWFVDATTGRRRDTAALEKDSRDNPTIR